MSDAQKRVQDAIDQLVASGAEVGMQVAVYQHGERATRSGFTSCLKGGNALTRPVIPLTVPYRNVRPQQWDGAKLSGQCNHRHLGDHRPRERNVGLLASSG
jgi:hypothetical protein